MSRQGRATRPVACPRLGTSTRGSIFDVSADVEARFRRSAKHASSGGGFLLPCRWCLATTCSTVHRRSRLAPDRVQQRWPARGPGPSARRCALVLPLAQLAFTVLTDGRAALASYFRAQSFEKRLVVVSRAETKPCHSRFGVWERAYAIVHPSWLST